MAPLHSNAEHLTRTLHKPASGMRRGVQHGAFRGTGPVNDDCAGAILLTPSTSCNLTVTDVAGATQSLAAITCNTYTGVADNDVWFKFVATSASHNIMVTGSADFDAVVDLRSGACNGTNIACADATVEGETETINATGLTIGVTYYVRVYDYYSGDPTTTDVSICVTTPGAAPPNDLCSGVSFTSLPVGGAVDFTGDNTGATIAGDYGPGSGLEALGLASVWHGFTIASCANVTVTYCGLNPAWGDVWIVLSTGCPADDNNVVFNTDFNDTDCGDGNFTINYVNLPAGNYYLPVMLDPALDAEGPYTVHVSATACGAGPANDDCVNAIPLTPSTNCVPVAGDVQGATQSLPAITCNGFLGNANDDVWYSFVATATSHIVHVDGADTLDAVVELLTGTCGSLTSLDCADATLGGDVEEINATGLTIGQTYYVRVYDWYTGYPIASTFTICILTSGGGTPVNDQCGGIPTPLLNVGGSLNFSGTTSGATTTNDAVPLSDMDDGIPKVWHAFTLNGCADVTVDYCGTTPAFDQVYIVVTACPASTFTAGTYDFTTCVDGNATIHFTALPAGTYYLPVGLFGAGSTGSYQMTVTATACATAPPNDDCAGAIPLTPAGTCVPVAGDVQGATESLPAITCNGFLGNANDDVWYSFVATATTHIVHVDGADTLDAVVEILAGTCGNLTSLDCADATLGGGVEEINASGLTIGQTYYVRVYDWYGGYPIASTFTICILTPGAGPANDECANAITLPINLPADCPANAVTGDNTNSTVTLDDPDCDATTDGYQDVWYTFNSLGNTAVTVTLDWGTATDLFIEVLDACNGNSVFCDVGTASPYTVNVTPNTDYVVRVFSNNQYGVGGVFTICLSGAISTAVGTQVGATWSVFPNPNEGRFSLRYAGPSGDAIIDLFDATGRGVYHARTFLNDGGTYAVTPASGLAKGAYTLRVTTVGSTLEERIMVR
ncbi:MAG: T9SS type A sorting domain-containing protein [Flavobacteriales bacterium]|nr:T9SS type A sorting domain-containing protein [Flavobacteriales bacterium]MCB9167944.1 T9SS type A sorting domain-containing protein [Flavobacteriales bacterium]